MKRLILTILMISQLYLIGYSQRTCVADDCLNKSIEANSGLRGYLTQLEEAIQSWIRNYPFHPQLHRSSITIPVVVHVVYKNATENVSDAQIQSQITALNRDYKKLNTTEIQRAPTAYRNLAAKTYIQFELAKRDPNGRATTGIIRKSTTTNRFVYNASRDSEAVKRAANGSAAWDTKKYLNLWVCDLWQDNGAGPRNTLLGYGTFPGDTTVIQGVAIDYACFGTTGTARAPFNKGRTGTHEVGHYLDLRHIWGDGGCGATDHVSDTPDAAAENYGCPTYPHISCSNGPDGDMFMNFMDYTDDSCMYMFTMGQRARMLAHFKPGGLRAGLATSNGLIPPTATTINYQVYLESQNSSFPSWKAAMVMIHGWACQCTPDVDQMVQQNSSQSGRHITGIPNDVSEVIHALALTPEEIITCYSASGFYNLLRGGPIALLSVESSEYYGLVINGMSIDAATGNARLSIKDPMNIGPRGFLMTNQSGAEYTVDYNEFMTQILERMASQNKKVYIVYPPSSPI